MAQRCTMHEPGGTPTFTFRRRPADSGLIARAARHPTGGATRHEGTGERAASSNGNRGQTSYTRACTAAPRRRF